MIVEMAVEDPGCEWWNVACNVGEAAADVISAGANDALREIVQNVLEGYGKAIASLGTLWVNVPSPVTITDVGGGVDVGGGTPPESAAFETILSYVTWVSAGIAVMSLIFAGVMMAARRRHGDGEAHMGRLGIIILSVLLLSSASALVTGFFPDTIAGNNASSVVGFLQNQLWWYAGGLAILSIMIAAARMAWLQRAEPLRELMGALLTFIAVSGAGLTVIVLATSASDAFAVWILDNSTDCEITDASTNCFGENIFAMISLTSTSPIGLMGVLVLGLFALLASYAQVLLMIVRGGMLVILAGILPVTAAFTNTQSGRTWFNRAIGWTIAFILYKPAAAIVYAAAFRLIGSDLFASDGSGLVQILTGLALMLIALIALPALMRFVAPAVTAVTSGGGGGMLAAGALVGAAGAEMATGAVRASSSNSRASGGGGGNYGSAAGPTGTGSAGGGGQRPPASPAGAPGGAAAAGGGATAGGAASAGGGAGAAAGGGAAAGAAGGPVGVAVMAGASAAADGAKKVSGAVKQAADDATGGNQ